MKLGIGRDDLAGIIAWAAKALPTRPSATPILAGIRLDATGGALKASAFDNDTAASATTGARADGPGTVLVPGRLFTAIVASLDGEVAEISATSDVLALRCDGAAFTLPTLPLGEYPALPAMPAAAGACDGQEFAQAVSRVVIAATHDDTLESLTTVSFEATGGTLTLTATDRYRLATTTLPWEPASADTAEARALIPARTLAGLAKSLDGRTVTIALEPGADICRTCYGLREPATEPGKPGPLRDGESCPACDGTGTFPTGTANLAGFSDGTHELVTRCIAGEFSKWRHLIPQDPSTVITIDSGWLTAAVRQAALVAPSGLEQVVRITVADGAVLLKAAGDSGTAEVDAGEVTTEGEPLRIAFHARRLTDGLTAAGGQVQLKFTAPGKPALITPSLAGDTYQHLVMPFRVDD